MNASRRFLLTVTLTLLLFGLAAHSLPANYLCGCSTSSESGASASNFDLCLVCQLRTGIHTSPLPVSPDRDNGFVASEQLALNPLERVFPVSHPPTA